MKYSGDSSAGQMHPPLLHRFNAPLTWGTVFCASSFHAHEMVCSLSQTTINGGPVLQWRGPFFFLPTNPLHMAHIPNLWGRPIRLLERRHRGTQLATTSNAHSKCFQWRLNGYGVSYFGCYPLSASESIFPPTSYEIRTHQSALAATNCLVSNQMSRNDVLHGCIGILQSSTIQLYPIWANK